MLKCKIVFYLRVFFVFILELVILSPCFAFAVSYTITAASGRHGSIKPSGDVVVNAGQDITFNMIPDTGYVVENVQINGISLGAMTNWTFQAVSQNHEIHVSFKSSGFSQYVIKATAGEHGSIDPAGEIVVDKGDNLTFTISPDDGYEIDDVLIDDVSQEAKTSHTFSSIVEDHSIRAVFKAAEDEPKRIKIIGSVSHNETPLCTMILANGQHMFFCDESIGKYELDVPLDDNGEITLFAFCDGLAPFKKIQEITLSGTAHRSRVKLKRTLLNIMASANGQYLFSPEKDGKYELEIPLYKKGQINLFGFCDGFQLYKQILKP